VEREGRNDERKERQKDKRRQEAAEESNLRMRAIQCISRGFAKAITERERERKRLSTECLHHRITHDRYREGCAPFYRARAVFSAGAFALASNYSLLTRADRKEIDV